MYVVADLSREREGLGQHHSSMITACQCVISSYMGGKGSQREEAVVQLYPSLPVEMWEGQGQFKDQN